MSLTGGEVGRVHIRVVPDFTHFHATMLKELAKWEGKNITIDIKGNADHLRDSVRGMNKEVSKASKDLGKTVSKELSKSKVKVAPVLDSKTVTKNRLQSQLNKLLSDLEPALEFKGANNAALRDFWDKEIKAAQKQVNKLDVELDTRSFNAQASFVLATLNKIRKESMNLRNQPALNTGRVENSARLAEGMKKAADLARDFELALSKAHGTVQNIDKAFLSVNKGGAIRTLREYVYGFRDISGEQKQIASNIDRFRMRGGIIGGLVGGVGVLIGAKTALGGLGKMVAGLADKASEAGKQTSSFIKGLNPQGLGLDVSAAGFAVLAGAITLVAAPAIGLLSAALLTLPGILATVMAPIGATILGFEGIKKAAENAGLFGDKNGAKKGGGSLGKALEEIQKNTQDVFERTLTEPFKKIGDAANQLIAPMQTVAQGVADVMTDIINSITSEANMSRISETFKGIGLALSNSFGPGLAKFSDGLIGLAAEFTKPGGALEGIGKWFDDTMGDFKNWVNEGIKSGELTETFRQLGDSIRIVLELAGDLAQKGLDFVSDPAKMQGFKDTLKEIADLLGKVMTLSRELAPLWTALGGALGALADPFDKLGKVIDNPGNLGNWNDLAKSLIPDGSTGVEMAKGWFNKDAISQAAAEAGTAAAEQFNITAAAIMAADKETQKAMFREAFTGEGITTAVQTQMTQQAQIAITGVQQALVPLKEGLQSDIDAALAPLGDVAGRVQAAFDGIPAQIQGSLGQLPGIITTAMGSLATDAQTAMQGVSDAVTEHCALAVNTATTQAPLIAEPFKALAGGMAQVGADMMAGLGQGIRDNVHIAEEAARIAATEVKEAAKAAIRSNSPSKDFMDIGRDTQTGLAIGIENNVGGPISAIREVMQAIKDVFGSAEGINLNFYMGDAAKSMSSLATSSKEFRNNMVEAGTSPALNPDSTGAAAATAADLADIKRQKAEIDLRIAELQAMKNATADKAAKAGLTAEIDQLKIQKERLDLLKEENGLQEERKTAIQKLSDTIATNIVDMIKMPGEFAKTTANAAMQDFGISGSGALPTIANWAMDAGTNFIFNVNNMDDAIQGQQAQQRKQTAGLTSR